MDGHQSWGYRSLYGSGSGGNLLNIDEKHAEGGKVYMATERKHHSRTFRCSRDDFTSILLSNRNMGLLHQRAHLLEGSMEPAEGKSMHKASR